MRSWRKSFFRIRSIHWWGLSLINSTLPWPPGDPVGMTFNITFYNDNNCWFDWMWPTDSDLDARIIWDGHWDATGFYDLSLVLTNDAEPAFNIVDVTGGFGATLQLKNNGNTIVDNFSVDFVVKGGIVKKIEVNAGDTISGLAPDNTMSLKTGMFFGLGKITIFVVGDGIAAYKYGIQLFMYTIVQK